MGSINLLEAVRSCASIRSLIYVTSDKCYENIEWIWGYREIDKLGDMLHTALQKQQLKLYSLLIKHRFLMSEPTSEQLQHVLVM